MAATQPKLPTCLKCGYVRQATDPQPAEECPRCGAIYKKMVEKTRREQQGVREVTPVYSPPSSSGSKSWMIGVLLVAVAAGGYWWGTKGAKAPAAQAGAAASAGMPPGGSPMADMAAQAMAQAKSTSAMAQTKQNEVENRMREMDFTIAPKAGTTVPANATAVVYARGSVFLDVTTVTKRGVVFNLNNSGNRDLDSIEVEFTGYREFLYLIPPDKKGDIYRANLTNGPYRAGQRTDAMLEFPSGVLTVHPKIRIVEAVYSVY